MFYSHIFQSVQSEVLVYSNMMNKHVWRHRGGVSTFPLSRRYSQRPRALKKTQVKLNLIHKVKRHKGGVLHLSMRKGQSIFKKLKTSLNPIHKVKKAKGWCFTRARAVNIIIVIVMTRFDQVTPKYNSWLSAVFSRSSNLLNSKNRRIESNQIRLVASIFLLVHSYSPLQISECSKAPINKNND